MKKRPLNTLALFFVAFSAVAICIAIIASVAFAAGNDFPLGFLLICTIVITMIIWIVVHIKYKT